LIVLDTNVVSELMRPAPSSAVVRWLSAQPSSVLHTTSVTEAEILHGIESMPPGKRRAAILESAQQMFEVEFGHRILPFDSRSAEEYARIASERRRAGRPISQFDAQIAAIVAGARAALATRNVADFDGCGVRLVNPWEG